MASAFASGFQMGSNIFNQAERNRLLAAQEARAAEMHGLEVASRRRAEARDAELDRIGGELRDATMGAAIPENQAANMGLQRQSLRQFEIGQQNYGDQAPAYVAPTGLMPERQAVNVNDPAVQARVAALRQQYALASRDMKDFDAVAAAERTRINSRDDADFALQVTRDPNSEAAVQARTFVNAQTKGFTIDPPNKDGISTLRIVQGDRTKPVDIDASELSRIAVGVRRLQRGDVGGLDVIASINKDIAAAVRAEMGTQLEALKANNDAAYKTGGLANDRERTQATRDYYGRAGQKLEKFQDGKTGEVVMVDVAGLPRGKDGRVQIPSGLKPISTRPEVTTKDVIDYAGQLTGVKNPATGKAYTPDEAMAEARRLLSGQPDPFMSKLDQLLGSGADPFAPPASKGGLVPPAAQRQPRITTIVPPRSSAEMVPRPELTGVEGDVEMMNRMFGR